MVIVLATHLQTDRRDSLYDSLCDQNDGFHATWEYSWLSTKIIAQKPEQKM